ncbi:MAG: HipA domain-containing protein [Gammaproteobacteria bacterium]|nr:HipA domain-containing protein [Gammaproteobacteria bacterium]
MRRFDRRGETRIPYMSARTALDWDSSEGRYYTDIADVIRQISSQPRDDLHELWNRIIFTILVSNTDDHLKNHGFIYAGRNRWRLSPAFDINPSPVRQRVLKTGILEGKPFDASLVHALDAARFFDIEQEDAKKMAYQMANIVNDTWRESFRLEGASASETSSFADAFQHDAMEQALALV